MSNIFISSDEHFSHRNLCKGQSTWSDKEKACRDFATIEEHDDYLIDVTNKKVKSSDVWYCCGDIGMGHGFKDRFKEIRRRINCETIFLAKGNHDSIFCDRNRDKYPELFSMFKEIKDIYYKKICGRFMVLCHYAMLTWPYQHHGSIHCFGHSHANLVLPNEMKNAKMIDVGRDTCSYGHKKYEVYDIEEIFHIMDTKQIVKLDHHSANTN